MAMKMTAKKIFNFKYARLGPAAVLLSLIATAGCSRGNVQAAAPAMRAPLVTVVKATAQDVPKYLDEIGHNAAFEAVTVTPQVGGRIVERHFQDGENLTKGQLLFVIDPRPYKAQLDSAQASLAQARAALDLARIQFARDEEVIGQNAISKQDYDTKKNTVDVDQAVVEAAQATLETAQLNTATSILRSMAGPARVWWTWETWCRQTPHRFSRFNGSIRFMRISPSPRAIFRKSNGRWRMTR
jgi:multidrug efflux pump subunit AcrA (membrane-fusion protein)